MRARIFAEENKKWWTLGAVAFGLFMIMLDNTVVNVALPTIAARPAHVDLASSSGSSTAYALTFAALLITGGKLGDCSAGAGCSSSDSSIFTLASLACGLAPSAGFLIGARAVQGVGAALMNPATLSIITATFPPKAARPGDRHLGRRLGARARDRPAPRRPDRRATSTGTGSSSSTSRSASSAIVVSQLRHPRVARHLARAEHRPARASSPPALGLFALSYALIEGEHARLDVGRDPRPLRRRRGLLAAFILLELRQRLPMLDLSLFKIGSFAGANIVAMLVSLGDVRRLLLRLALRPERPRLLADAGGRDLPADDGADHPRRADRREALRPDRLALADGRAA